MACACMFLCCPQPGPGRETAPGEGRKIHIFSIPSGKTQGFQAEKQRVRQKPHELETKSKL